MWQSPKFVLACPVHVDSDGQGFSGNGISYLTALCKPPARSMQTPDPRSLSMMLSPEGRGHIMMVGDGSGKLRIFGWNAMAAVAALPGAMQ